MKTPKQSADELVERHYNPKHRGSEAGKLREARYRAIITLEAIINANPHKLVHPEFLGKPDKSLIGVQDNKHYYQKQLEYLKQQT